MPLRILVIATVAISGMLIAGCTGAAAARPTVAQAPGPSVTAAAAGPAALTRVPTEGLPGWTTFTDPAMGYSISLPPGVDFRAGTSPAGIYTARAQFALPDVPGYQGMVVRIEPNPGGQGIDEILARLYRLATQQQAPADLAAEAQTLTVAGLAAVRAVPGGGTGGLEIGEFTIVVPYRDRVYLLAPVHELPSSTIAPQAQALFDQIVASFRVAQ